MILVHFGKSPRDGKKYVMKFTSPRKTIHFGSDVSTTYVEGASETTRNNYIKRHTPREDWDSVNAGSASRYILWGDNKNLKKNLKSFLKRFGIEDKIRTEKY
tara:strand:- start:10091 stop:10396 length:306 start_codon:yes stop_codon:yes gene_type:complete